MTTFLRFSLLISSLLLLTINGFSQDAQDAEEAKIIRPSNCMVSPFPVVITQPDNSQLTIIGKGNMVNHWTETTDGYSIVLKNGFYEYADKVNGDLIASGTRASNPPNRNASEINFLSNRQISLKPDFNPLKNSILNQVNAQLQNKTYPTTGNIRILALLIDYPDLTNTYPAANFDSLLYGLNYRNGDGSFKTFYETSSNNQLTVTVDVEGWYRAANNYIYYGRDSGYSRAADLVREAVDAAEVAGVNFSLYDNDSDGDVDGILTVHSGPGAESGSQTQFIWSHRWVLSGGTLGSVTYDGVSINDYMMNPETRGSLSFPRMVGIGVFCHEFGHNLGLPDLYDTDNTNGGSEGIGNWAVMAGGTYLGGEHRPGNFCAWSKVENGWETPSVIPMNSSGNYTLNAASTNQNEIYRVNTPVSTEYFLLENRQKTGLDLELPGEGLAIWHINTIKTNSPGNSVNGDEDLKGVDLEEADGLSDLDNEVNRGDAGDLYPGTAGRTTFDNTTNPNSQNYSGGASMLQLNNISNTGGIVSFSFGAAGVSCGAGVTNFNTPSGSFSDGSGNSNYANNQNCSWLIQPSTIPTSINIGFSAFATEALNDSVSIYAGTNNTAPLVATYSGQTIPPITTVNGPDAYVEFNTNATFNDLGWDASYTSTSAPAATCSGTTTLTTANGSFSDGSGAANYSNNLNCGWLIQPAGAASITFGFNSLATEINADRVIVYDGIDNTAPRLASYSGTNGLNSATSTGGSMFVEFITDNVNTDAGWDAFYTSTTSAASCANTTTLIGPNGTFSDGSGNANYLNNRFCSWLIQGSSGTITLSFSAFATEAGADRLLVFDGVDNSAPQIGNFSGLSIPASLTSSGSNMYIEFRTDGQNTDQGWDASYINNISSTPTCSGTTNLTAASGTFDDGSGPNVNYSNNLNCSWLISPSGVNNIRLITDSLALASGDSVVVYDGSNNTSPVLGTYKGNLIPPFVTSSGNDLFVEFHSDGTSVDSGFQMTYQTFSGCSGTQTLTAASGTFNDGTGITQLYANSSNCTWLIQPSGANFIDLSFNRFNTENCCDVVTIFDGATTSSPVLGSYRGVLANIPSIISSTGGSMLVQFTTDFSVTDFGWEATYTSTNTFCRVNQNLTAASGSFSDGSGASNYDNNSNCSWLISPPFSSSITINFSSFDTELNNDSVAIYDGIDNTGTLIASYSGSTVPAATVVNSSTVFVEFLTNGTNTAQGWDASYTSVQTASCSGNTSLTAASGNFEDGSGLVNYSDNLNCSWTISPPGNPASISFSLNSINLADFGDRVRVYDGTGNGAPLIATYFGTNTGNPAVAYSGNMFVEFVTNGAGNSSGWDASYNSSSTFCTPLTTLTNNFGNFTDGSPFGTNYADNSDCSWLIQPTAPNVAVSLRFFSFDTESGVDTLTVYDGATTSDPILRTISGSPTIIPNIISSGGSMLVTFKTNGSTTAAGWRASYRTQNIPLCGGTTNLTAASGTFNDGSSAALQYVENSNCSWRIEPTGASLVSLSFSRFSTANTGDIVSIYDGNSSTAPLIGSFSGSTLPPSIVSSGNSLFVNFITDGFQNDLGWEASYSSTNSQCFPSSTLTAFTDTIRDGSNTANYGDNLNCSWLIQPPTATSITFDFINIDLLAGDSVFIYDGTTNAASRIGAFSGNTLPAAVSTSAGDMFIEFVTNGSASAAGWTGTYTITSSQSCFGRTRLTAASGTFEDGSGLNNYDNNLNCEWLIQPSGNPAVITFDINSINLANFGDRVRVYDGTTTSAPFIGQFFGSNTGNTLRAFSGSMLVVFSTDNFSNAQGWDASYSSSPTFCIPSTTFTNNFGSFDDGSPFGTNYLNNTDCEWLIAPNAPGVAVGLRFFNFDTELNNDTLTVYDGSSTTDPILATYSGSINPPNVVATGNRMLVTFKSNSSQTAQGWRANYFTQQIPFCAGQTTFTAATGTFDDGSPSGQQYRENSNCSWLIQPTGASKVSLSFNRFDTQAGFDSVTVYDGSNSSAPVLGNFSGNNQPSAILSSGGSLFLTFKANNFIEGLGWEATYNSSSTQCFSNLLLNSFTDTIEDGSGSSNYQDNLNCSWLIQPPLATTITFDFLNFDLNSPGDSVFIYDGTANTANRIGAFSGTTLPPSVTTTGGDMFIEFVTDATTNAAGWRGVYNITSSQSCFGTTTLTAPSGNFEDGSGINNYDNDLNCEWLIQPTGNPTVITLTMNSMNLSNFGDRVRIYDGTSASDPIIASFFGTNTGNIVNALSGSMFVVFETDNFSTGQGWDASYNSSNTYCTSGNTLSRNSGIFSDGSPLGQNYLDNSDCSWLIQPTIPTLGVSLRFTQFSTELSNDTVTIYDGATTAAPILGTFSGSNVPPVTNSSGNALLVTFKSNGSVTASGWRATYNTFPIPACSGTTTLTAAIGTFDDGSGNGNNYDRNTNCSWLIQPAGAISVDANFNYFETELNDDVVSIYDGVDNTAPSLGVFSGFTIPSSITASSGSMFIEFSSDNFREFNGFEITYTSSNTVILDASPDTVFVNAGAGSNSSFNLASNSSWTTSDNAPWLIVTPVSGSGNQTMGALAIQPNIGPDRLAEAYINSTTANIKDTVVVIQRGSGTFMVANPDTLFFAGLSTGSQNVTVNASVNWSLASNAPWITINPNSGSNNGTSAINVNNNTTSLGRTSLVVLSGTGGVTNDTIVIVQAGAPIVPSLSVDPSTLSLNQAAGSSASFDVNSTVVWQTTAGDPWLLITNPTITSDTGTVQISAISANTTGTVRTTFVAVQDVGGNLLDTVFVSQQANALTLTIDPRNVTVPQSPITGSSNLLSNTDWVQDGFSPWLNTNATAGTGNATINFNTVSANNSTQNRTGFIAFRDLTSIVFDTLFVTQEGLPENLSVDPTAITLAQPVNSFDTFAVNANVNWQAISAATWLTVNSPANTSDTGKVEIVANSMNMNAAPRSTFVAVSDLNGTLFDTVFVSQLGNAPTLNANPDTIRLDPMAASNNLISISSNVAWTSASPAGWLSIAPISGLNNGTITATANSDNNTGSIRSTIVAIENVQGAVPTLFDTVIVIQDTLPTGLSTNPDTIRLAAGLGSSANYTIIAPPGFIWGSTTNSPWISIGQNMGSGTTVITASATSANVSVERIGYIETSAASLPMGIDTVVVIQEATPLSLTVSPAALNLGSAAGSNDILTVSSNVDWTITNPAPWLSATPNFGVDNGTVTVTATTANQTGAARTANVTFDGVGGLSQNVFITQVDGSTPTFEVSVDTVFVNNPQGSTGSFSILSNVSNWTISENAPWLLINPAQGSNVATITALVASRNVNGNPRFATVTAAADGFTSKEVVIVQRAATPLLNLAPTSVIIGADSSDFFDFNLSSNLIAWSVSETASWMEVSPTTGAFTQQVRVTAVESNLSSSQRMDVVTVDAPPLVPQTIMVTQDTIRGVGIEENIDLGSTKIYPNPTRGRVTVELGNNININNTQFELIDIVGKTQAVSAEIISAQKAELNLNGLAEGIYFLKITHHGKIHIEKISYLE